jgi:hypothetical protein
MNAPEPLIYIEEPTIPVGMTVDEFRRIRTPRRRTWTRRVLSLV